MHELGRDDQRWLGATHDAGELLEQGIELLRAGENGQAFAYFERAIELLQMKPDEVIMVGEIAPPISLFISTFALPLWLRKGYGRSSSS